MPMAKVGILLDQRTAERKWSFGINVFEAYIGEILAHVGIPYVWLDNAGQATKEKLDVLIAACAAEDDATAEQLWLFAEKGGVVISYAGLNRLAGKLGCCEQPAIQAGYARLHSGFGVPEPLRFLQARPWRNVNRSVHEGEATESGTIHKERPDGESAGPALWQFAVGKGHIDRWSVNIPYTVVGFQQGTKPVFEDGVPAADRTGPVNDGILKADDCCEMDWELDRLTTEMGAPYYALPYADLWREAAIAHVLQRAVGCGLTLPFIGYWPDGIAHVAVISHDSDGNEDAHAEKTLDVLAECGICSTWCMLEPGYSAPVYERVKQAGHELAFHYNALDKDGGYWEEEEFKRQFAWLKEAAALTEVTSNKNHYTRFEGYGELFAWCERAGIACDQTRGPSKKGNAGFLFGTCHPYFPIAWSNDRNRLYNVLEVGFLTQDLGNTPFIDMSVIVPFLEQVRRVEGIAHFLFHQVHIKEKPYVADAMRKLVNEAHKRGFLFWTTSQINVWNRRCRSLRITGVDDSGNVELAGKPEIDRAVVWIPVVEAGSALGDCEMKFGIACRKQVLYTG